MSRLNKVSEDTFYSLAIYFFKSLNLMFNFEREMIAFAFSKPYKKLCIHKDEKLYIKFYKSKIIRNNHYFAYRLVKKSILWSDKIRIPVIKRIKNEGVDYQSLIKSIKEFYQADFDKLESKSTRLKKIESLFKT